MRCLCWAEISQHAQKKPRVIQLTSTSMRTNTAALHYHRHHQVEQEQLTQHSLVPESCRQSGCEKTSGLILLLLLPAGKAVDIFCSLESLIQSQDLLIFETSEIQGCPSEACCLKTVEEVWFLLSFSKLTDQMEKWNKLWQKELEITYKNGNFF